MSRDIYYRINRYPHVWQSTIAREPIGYSIDETLPDGTYLCQEAYWYHTAADARADLARITEENAVRGDRTITLDTPE